MLIALPLIVCIVLIGFSSGLAAPSRDLLVKRSTPDNATGRVYGVVYSGLDIGQALSPLIFGLMMDHGAFDFLSCGVTLLSWTIAFLHNERLSRPFWADST
jgi:FSR family fosmidomycin resistance protein-like MFS transporter